MHYPKLFLAFLATILLYSTAITPLQAYNNTPFIQRGGFSQNLDLNVVASLFGQSRDLSDFEWRLNDPYNQISNLDLNADNQVDYLRIIERARGNMRLIIIQAVIGPNFFQDIAVIELYRNRYNKTSIQIIGDPYIYGDNYMVNPYYVYAPVIYNYFWRSRNYNPYYSRYKWGRYPRHYRAWRPRSIQYYNRHVYKHIDRRNRYDRSRVRKNKPNRNIYRGARRNDYARKHPNRSYNKMQPKTYQSQPNRPDKRRNSRQADQTINSKSNRPITHKPRSDKANNQRIQNPRQQTREQERNRQQSYHKNQRHPSTQQRTTQSRETRSTRQQSQSRQQRETTQRHQTRQTIQQQSLQQREPRQTRTDRQSDSARPIGR